ncbi:hypothetical protein AHMF7616_00294 [Adhaeribacter pallidiroseus]|uniref:Uncharacterized protein n=1 Tax=Adhaeribacter pallidiroseus TaxID=2072847 RepID=A0A369Q9Y9_9BACT|nr:hypothetical protein AHMF7616_00294 [Adhaeribacter pallidiroseus]
MSTFNYQTKLKQLVLYYLPPFKVTILTYFLKNIRFTSKRLAYCIILTKTDEKHYFS